MHAVLYKTLINHRRETKHGVTGRHSNILFFFLFPEPLPRRGRLDKAPLELDTFFQSMGITAYKGDFQACKLKLTSLGANQKKRAYFHEDSKERQT